MPENKFLYLQLYDTLKSEIESGVIAPGEKLPLEADLRARFGVSAITIKKGLSMLAEDGLVRRVPGQGTFARGNAAERAPVMAARPRNDQLIGLVLEHVSTPFGLEMLYAIDRQLYAKGYRLCVRYSYADRDRETEEINFLLALGVAGLIIMPCHGNFYNPTLLRLILDDFPIVLVDKKLSGIPVPSVRTDNTAAIAVLVRHLYERGSRRIGLLSVEAEDTTSLSERVEGFQQEIARLGLEECPACFVQMSKDFVSNEPDGEIVQDIRTYLVSNQDIDAVVCTEYGLVSCLTAAAREQGVAIGPEGLRVCCVDEDYLAPEGYTFTHVRQDEIGIAAQAVDILLSRLGDGDTPAEDAVRPAIFRQGKTT